jgi:hypothetical protein
LSKNSLFVNLQISLLCIFEFLIHQTHHKHKKKKKVHPSTISTMAPTAQPPPPPPRRRRSTTTTTSKRKRRTNDADAAERLRQYGVDLPQIPGLPLTIIPLHVFALKTTSQCFRRQQDETSRHAATAIPPYHMEESESEHHGSDDNNGNGNHDASLRGVTSGGGGGSNNVMDRILDRVAQQQAVAAAVAATTATTATATLNGNVSSNGSSSDKREQLERKRKDSIATWLNAIHRQVKDEIQFKKRRAEQQQEQQQGPGNSSTNKTSHNNTSSSSHSVVISALEHLWSIGLDHDRIHVRRAALHMAGHLLQKSADARSWLLDNNNARGGSSAVVLAKWLDGLTATKTRKSSSLAREESTTTTTATQHYNQQQHQRRLWQREGYLLLQHLDVSGYSDFYPCLPVALQRLEQEFAWMMMMMHPAGDINNSTENHRAIMDEHDEEEVDPNGDDEDHDNNNNNSMVDWRKWRDLAMEHCDEEARRVRKLLTQCQVYMDVLVPRVGVINTSEEENDKKQTDSSAGRLKHDANDSDGDDDEGDVAWEDGFEVGEEGSDNDDDAEEHLLGEHVSATRHAENVERTLQIMQTAAGLQDGELEINLQQPPSTVNFVPTSTIATASEQESSAATSTVDRTSPQAIEAWNRLEKTVAILYKRHKRRLSMWVSGLTHADGLVHLHHQQQQQPDGRGNGALVQMSRDKMQRRQSVLNVLVQLKSAVVRTLSLAKRLGIRPPPTTTTATNSEQSTIQSTSAAAAATAPAATTTTTSSRSDVNIAISLATPRQRHQEDLTATLMRQQTQPNRPHQHRRVQIKYRKK